MSVLGWILLGLIAGFIGSKIVNKSGQGMLLDIVLGIVGAIVGGLLFSLFGATGVTPFRADVKKDEVRDYSYSAIVDQIGEPMVAFDHDPQAYAAGRDAFVERWRSLFVNAQ